VERKSGGRTHLELLVEEDTRLLVPAVEMRSGVRRGGKGKGIDEQWEWAEVSIEMKQESTADARGVVPVTQIE
jgi:hypothetical protein